MNSNPSTTRLPERSGQMPGSTREGYLGLFFIPFFWSAVIFGVGSLIFHSFGIMPFLSGALLSVALLKLRSDYVEDLKIEAAMNDLKNYDDEQPPKPSYGVYVCNQFTGFYPVGTAAAVVSDSQQNAAELLNKQLKRMGLPGDADANMMGLVVQDHEQAVILCVGNY